MLVLFIGVCEFFIKIFTLLTYIILPFWYILCTIFKSILLCYNLPVIYLWEENLMNNIVLHNNPDISYTHIDNLFIDDYMPYANGSYVKVYLLIIRRLSENRPDISISDMADTLELTEKDILRAIRYWQKKILIILT